MAVGGDFFDIWEIQPNRLGVFISDVMGHGVSAAFVTVFIKTILAEFQEQIGGNPARILEILNTRFNDMLSSRVFMFATAFCGVIDCEKGELACANAGIPSPSSTTVLNIPAKSSAIKKRATDWASGVTQLMSAPLSVRPVQSTLPLYRWCV